MSFGICTPEDQFYRFFVNVASTISQTAASRYSRMLRLMQTTFFGFRVLLFNSSQLSTNNNQNESKYLTAFVLHKTSFNGFSQTSLRLLLTWAVKIAETPIFRPKKTMNKS